MRTEPQVAAMQCPVCNVPLAMSDRQGIEIDYCPQCRGVWLDRGELDKIIERSAALATTSAGAPEGPPRRHRDDDDDDRKRQRHVGYGDRDDRGAYGRPTRKSFLNDLFDFG